MNFNLQYFNRMPFNFQVPDIILFKGSRKLYCKIKQLNCKFILFTGNLIIMSCYIYLEV